MKRSLFAISFCVLVVCGMQAAVISNGYYKFKNVASSNYLAENYATAGLRMCGSATNTTNDCIWKVTNNSNGTVLITNVYTQRWICGQMTVAQTLPCSNTSYGTYAYTPEVVSSGIYRFVFYRWDSTCALFLNQGCHSYNTGTDSQWKLEAVSMTDEQATAAAGAKKVNDMNNAYETWNTTLLKYFTDLSCSELKTEYQSKTDDELRAAMTDLTSDFKDIAIKVKNGWSDDGVEGRTKQFRVQEYKVYSDAYTWASKLGSWSMGDMNNPTGIYANQKEILYVFVGGDIPDGTQVRLAPNYGNGYISRSNGPLLHKGMNAVMISGDNYMQWIMYTALSNPTTTPLSKYPKLKIHIEGGHVLGYMNCESDKYSTIKKEDEATINAKYKQILADANTLATADGKKNVLWFTTKGNYGVFLFPLNSCYNYIWGNGKIYKSMLWYDNVLMWIYDLMGINKRTIDGEADPTKDSKVIENVTGGEDFFPTYCNNKALTILDENDKSPNGGSWHTDYPSVAAVKSSYDYDNNAAMDNWCTAHESGHQNQSRINMASGTEVSNNLFSNVVVYNHGYRLSRGETLATNLNYYLNGTQYAHRGGGMTHRMYYQLYLYYHMAQHKMDFYPELFKLLRNDPMNINSGKDSFLKFYKYSCMAAKEDLTEFFRVWGFFVPFNNAFFGDYTNRYLTLTQEEINAAIKEVKQLAESNNWRRNDEIILIEDRIQNVKRADIYSNGTENRVAMDRAAGSGVGDLGHFTDFMTGSYSKGNYTTYSRSGNTITITGDGGVGFLVYNGDNEVIGFSNKKTFTLNEGAFSHTGITYKAIDGDGNKIDLSRNTGDAAAMLTQLKSYISDAEWVLGRADQTETKVGYFHPSALTNLQELYNQAVSVRDNGQDYLYDTAGSKLSDETNKVKNSTYSRIWFATGNSYYLKNMAVGEWAPYLVCNDAGVMSLASNSNKQKWLFESAGGNNYYFKNVNYGKYFDNMTRKQATATATSTSGAYACSMTEYQKEGKFYINPNDKKNNLGNWCYLGYEITSSGEYVCGTKFDDYYTQWAFYLADETSASKAVSALTAQVAAAEAALNKVGYGYKDVTYTYTPKTLRTCRGPFSLTSNAEQADGMLEQLYDNDASKGFHSSWNKASLDGGDHYIQIDCGTSDKTDLFKFSFTNRGGDSDAMGRNSPTVITIQGSNDGTNFTDIRTLTTADGLPTATGKQSSFESGVIGTPGVKYRYLRFVVTKTNTDDSNYIANYGHTYFFLAEFSISKVKADMVYTAMDGYSNVSKSAILAVKQELETAKNLLGSGTEAQKNTETPILKASVERLTAATASKTPDEEVEELTDDEMYKYEVALEDAIADAENAKVAMATSSLDAQIAAAQRVRDDATSTYLNMVEEKEVLVDETKSQLKSGINTKLTAGKEMLNGTMESYSYQWVTDTTYTYTFERKDAYHELDVQSIARLISAICEAEKITEDENFNDTTTQAIITAYKNLAAAFDGLNKSKLNIEKVPTLANEKYFKYYAEGGKEKPGYPTYDAYLIMREVYDADQSADEIVEAWDEYLASPRALPQAGSFYRLKCAKNNYYLYSSTVAVTNKANRLAVGATGTTDASIFLWTGKNLCGFANNTTVTMNTNNMLSNNTVSGSSVTQIVFESEVGTEKLFLKFNGGARVAYGGRTDYSDAGGTANEDEGYRWYVEPVEEKGDIRDYALDVLKKSEKVGWPGYRSKAAAKTMVNAVEDAQGGNADSLLITFDRMYKFINSFQYPEDGMLLRLRGSNSGNFIIYGTQDNKYPMSNDTINSIFYYKNGNLLCYNNGIYMDAAIDGWKWKDAGASTGGNVRFYKANKDNRFFITIPSSRTNKPVGAMYDDTSKTDQGSVADSAALCGLSSYIGYYWYLDLVEYLPVTVGATGYATFSSPVELKVPDDVTAYFAKSYNPEGSVLTMQSVQDYVIPANTGVLLKGKSAENIPFCIVEDEATNIENNMLKPVVASMVVTPDDGYTVMLLGKKDETISFYRMNTTSEANRTMTGHKAYLQIKTEDLKNAQAKGGITISWDDASGIEETSLSTALSTRDGVYNLQGMKVNENYKGIVIKNGKKCFLK